MKKNIHIPTDQEVARLTAYLNSDKLPEELLPYAAAAALCLGTGYPICEILSWRIWDIFPDEPDDLPPPGSFPESLVCDLKGDVCVTITVSFPWGELGFPVWRWGEVIWKKINAEEDSPNGSFIGRKQISCSKNLKQIARLAGLNPENITFEGLWRAGLGRLGKKLSETIVDIQKVRDIHLHAAMPDAGNDEQ